MVLIPILRSKKGARNPFNGGMEGLINVQVSSRLLVEGVPVLALITHADSC
jgi:hypothetical protein